MSQNQLSEEEFKEWWGHPVTVRLRMMLRVQRESLMMDWAKGRFTAQDQFGTAIANAEAIGKCQIYGELETLEMADLQESESE
jgi:hypothetical protein